MSRFLFILITSLSSPVVESFQFTPGLCMGPQTLVRGASPCLAPKPEPLPRQDGAPKQEEESQEEEVTVFGIDSDGNPTLIARRGDEIRTVKEYVAIFGGLTNQGTASSSGAPAPSPTAPPHQGPAIDEATPPPDESSLAPPIVAPLNTPISEADGAVSGLPVSGSTASLSGGGTDPAVPPAPTSTVEVALDGTPASVSPHQGPAIGEATSPRDRSPLASSLVIPPNTPISEVGCAGNESCCFAEGLQLLSEKPLLHAAQDIYSFCNFAMISILFSLYYGNLPLGIKFWSIPIGALLISLIGLSWNAYRIQSLRYWRKANEEYRESYSSIKSKTHFSSKPYFSSITHRFVAVAVYLVLSAVIINLIVGYKQALLIIAVIGLMIPKVFATIGLVAGREILWKKAITLLFEAFSSFTLLTVGGNYIVSNNLWGMGCIEWASAVYKGISRLLKIDCLGQLVALVGIGVAIFFTLWFLFIHRDAEERIFASIKNKKEDYSEYAEEWYLMPVPGLRERTLVKRTTYTDEDAWRLVKRSLSYRKV